MIGLVAVSLSYSMVTMVTISRIGGTDSSTISKDDFKEYLKTLLKSQYAGIEHNPEVLSIQNQIFSFRLRGKVAVMSYNALLPLWKIEFELL